jgi:hypothetical protein
MKMRHVFAILLVTGVPAASRAQGTTALAIGAGASAPIGRLRETQSSGTDFNLGLIRGRDESPIGLRLDFGYDRLPGKTVSGVKHPERKTISGTANVVFSFSGYTVKPYLLGGAGAFKMTSKPAVAAEKTRFGFDFGLGFTLPVAGKAAFIEARVNSISQHTAKPLRFVPINVGFLF